MFCWWLLAVLAAAVSGFASPLERQGDRWTQVNHGTLTLAPDGKLKIITRGPVTVRGGSGEFLTYRFVKRVRAANEKTALSLLAPVLLKTKLLREWTYLGLGEEGRKNDVLTELEVRVPRSFQQAIVKTESGDVLVEGVQAQVEAESGGGAIDMDEIAGDAAMRTGGGEIRLGTMHGSVRSFSAGGSIVAARVTGESWFETAGGEIHLRETRGPVHAVTAGGNIRVERAGSTVAAHTAGGRIDVQRAEGAVTAANSGGSIVVGRADGCRCESADGAIRLRGTSGVLRAISDAGSIWAELVSGVPLRDSTLSTGSGDITVLIPSNLALTIRARSENHRTGRIVSEFAEVSVRQLERAAAWMAEGSLNGGGPVLQISVAGGTIYLRRQGR